MSLFKVFRGDSTDLESVDFHDGYAYFTPDDGGFYIDAEVDDEEKRICINPKSRSIDIVINCITWNIRTQSQTVIVSGITSDTNGILAVSQIATD